MSNYNTSREPMTMDEFIALAESHGWTLAAKDADQNVDEINLVDLRGRMIVAFPQPTIHGHHIGFRGSVYGLCEVWDECTTEQKVLEGQILDEDTTVAGAIEAYEAVLAYYDPEPDGADQERRELSETAGQPRTFTEFMEIDARWGLWTPSTAEKAHFTASRETVKWLRSRRDGESDLELAKAYDRLAQTALDVLAEAAEPPLTQVETDMAWSVFFYDADHVSQSDLVEEWMLTAGRAGARSAIDDFADRLDEADRFTEGVTVSTHPVAVVTGRRDHGCYPNFAFAVTQPSLAEWLGANRAALPEPPYVAPISIRECVEEAEIVCDTSTEVAPLVITMADPLADEFRTRFPHLIATFVPFGGAAAAGAADNPLADDQVTLSPARSANENRPHQGAVTIDALEVAQPVRFSGSDTHDVIVGDRL
jgi:hypothetical protein